MVLKGELHLIFNIIDNHINSFFEDIIKAVISVTLKTAILIILLTFSKTIKTNRTLHIIPKSVYVLIIINVTLMGAITSITGYNLSIESNITKRITITNALLLLIFIISIAITVSLISNCISKAYYNKINSILEKQIENQIEYYNQTEMLNSDLRRFKHDYTNHILCLKALIDSNQNNEALEYIEKINSEISLSTKTFNTGHKIADAILNEKHRIHSDISIKFEGCIPDFIDKVFLENPFFLLIVSKFLDNIFRLLPNKKDIE